MKDSCMKIYCPKCRYEPSAQDRWECSCGHTWNTFDTLGQCPECGEIWLDTQCPACGQWSKHCQWYHYQPPLPEKSLKKRKPKLEMA
jgi:hypothetical protein